MDIRERHSQWALEDWKRDIAVHEDCRARYNRLISNPHAADLLEYCKRRCNEIADRWPAAKLERIA